MTSTLTLCVAVDCKTDRQHESHPRRTNQGVTKHHLCVGGGTRHERSR